MDFLATYDAVRSWSLADRKRLIDLIQDSIEADTYDGKLTPAQAAELDRRIADADENPGDELPWEQVYAEVCERLQKRRDLP